MQTVNPIFIYNAEKTVAMICRILDALGKTSIRKLMKLLFLIDKEHLNKYGRLVSEDRYFAAPYGPVPSITLGIFEKKEKYIKQALKIGALSDTDTLKLFDAVFDVNENIVSRKGECSKDKRLSSSDKKIIDKVINDYGSMEEQEIIDYTHELNEFRETKPGDQIDYEKMMVNAEEGARQAYRLHTVAL
ncbi:MAG: Panacea domain-containing protein [Fibrobacter sp.]|jgi:uncharacterized phage-associated protein|uniref:Panacea domain-containing protein n=1 Tax=Fibrobacter sp. TaxID=35828 RepID=UPI002A9138E4|nr:Panacea domain-containing protein [Fibrobacter sp.]MDY6263118.1 Panacea domain-containing protein [Fibrobacter sp.]